MTSGKRIFMLILPVVIAAALLVGAWLWLGIYTRHNDTVTVPDLAAMHVADASDRLEALGLHAEVIDSVYSEESPKSTVVDQDPDPGHAVKPGRTIYLVMNASQPKMQSMPQLVNLSKRQAISVLEILGLKVAELQYRPDLCLDCVVAQLYKGQPIAADARIRRGESVTLVLGSGMEGERVPVPDVRGMRYEEMKAVLNMASLNVGLVVEVAGCDNSGCDTALAWVVRQTPMPAQNATIGPGGLIDVWLTMDSTATAQP